MVKLEKFHGVGFYDDRICGTSRSDRQMRCYPVSTRINSVVNDDELCSASVELAEIQDRLFSQSGSRSILRRLRTCCESPLQSATDMLKHMAAHNASRAFAPVMRVQLEAFPFKGCRQ